jgi:hypothetical protein
MSKKWLRFAVWGLAFVANPYVACSESSESDFTYSEADMKLSVLGAWQGTAEVDGVSTPFSLSLDQASSKSKTQSIMEPKRQPQCGSRSFVKPAAACSSETTMPVVGSLSSENPAFNGGIDGYVVAYRTLDFVELQLRLESGMVLSGTLKDQALSEGLLMNAAPAGSFSLSRP